MTEAAIEIPQTSKKRKNPSSRAPFLKIPLSLQEYISNQYGQWILPLLGKKLLSPTDLHTVFAIRMTAAMKMIGEQVCTSSDDLYSLVTSSAYFKDENHELKELRRAAYKAITAHRNKRKKDQTKVSVPVAKKEKLPARDAKPAPVKESPKNKEIDISKQPAKRPKHRPAPPVIIRIGQR